MRVSKAIVHALIVALAVVGGVSLIATPNALAKKSSAPGRGPGGARSYWVVTKSGKVCATGSAKHYGNGHGVVAGIEGTADGNGYWLVLKSGKTQPFGDAKHEKYRKAKTVKWTKALGSCKEHVVSAAVARVKTPAKAKPKPPSETTTKTTTSTSTTSSTTTTPLASSATTTEPPAGGDGSTPPPTTTTGSTTTPPPATTTTGPTTTTSTVTTSPPPPPPVKPTISTQTVPPGESGLTYSSSLTATGGAGGYRWTCSGSLPAGVSLAADGTFSGTPRQSGTFSFSATVTTSDGGTATESYTLSILSVVSVGDGSVGDFEVGVTYAGLLSATGGAGSYTWTKTGGQLPTGLTLSNTGEITGTPTTAGGYTFTATATDGLGGAGSQTFVVTVDPPVSISTTEIPDPVATLSYDQQLDATGGTGGYSWSLASGSLPQGVSLTSSGEITGTPSPSSTGSDLGLPTAGGSYTFTAEATDSLGGTVTQAYTVLVAAYNNVDGQGQTWSGYTQVGAGAYTSVTGTFTVPTLVPATPPTGDYADGTTSEWVGIDGDGNDSLIQAGVSSSYTATGDVIEPWTEYITNGDSTDTKTDVPDFLVNPGDSITVTITEANAAANAWTMAMTDDTTGQGYQTTVTYQGAGATAEWIVEAPIEEPSGHISPTAPFFGTINFTNLGASQPATGQQYMSFEEDNGGFGDDGAEMSSLLDSSGFVVDDTGVVPPPL